jgi:hypothetical protein
MFSCSLLEPCLPHPWAEINIQFRHWFRIQQEWEFSRPLPACLLGSGVDRLFFADAMFLARKHPAEESVTAKVLPSCRQTIDAETPKYLACRHDMLETTRSTRSVISVWIGANVQ